MLQKNKQGMIFWPKFVQKWTLGLKFRKSYPGFGISFSKIPCIPIFRQNRQLWLFPSKFGQKWILGLKFQKTKSGFEISTSKIPCVPIFSQNRRFDFFGLNVGKLRNYVPHNILVLIKLRELQRIRQRLKYAGLRWVELGGGRCTV